MSTSCCEKNQTKRSQECCDDSCECFTIICGSKAQQYSERGASCVINCNNEGNLCNQGTGCLIKCKGKSGTCCEINCGCCSVAVEKCEDDDGSCCKITCCADKGEDRKECVLSGNKKGGSVDGKYCMIKCGGKVCCVIKC